MTSGIALLRVAESHRSGSFSKRGSAVATYLPKIQVNWQSRYSVKSIALLFFSHALRDKNAQKTPWPVVGKKSVGNSQLILLNLDR